MVGIEDKVKQSSVVMDVQYTSLLLSQIVEAEKMMPLLLGLGVAVIPLILCIPPCRYVPTFLVQAQEYLDLMRLQVENLFPNIWHTLPGPVAFSSDIYRHFMYI